jgi:hypothetical protein
MDKAKDRPNTGWVLQLLAKTEQRNLLSQTAMPVPNIQSSVVEGCRVRQTHPRPRQEHLLHPRNGSIFR